MKRSGDCGSSHRDLENDALAVLHGIVICGLTLFTVQGSGQSLFRTLAAVLAGRALSRGSRVANETRGRADQTMLLGLATVWGVSFSPGLPLGNPDAMRSGAVAGMLVLALGGVPVWWRLVTALSLILAGGVETVSHGGFLGNLEFATGAAWPRGWNDVATACGWFVLGSAMTGDLGVASRLSYRGAHGLARLTSLRALGRMPLTVIVMNAVGYAAIRAVNASNSAWSLVLLTAEILAAQLWLRAHASGPVEIALQSVRAAYVSLGGSLRRRFVPGPVEIIR